jgi:hypothetical protein
MYPEDSNLISAEKKNNSNPLGEKMRSIKGLKKGVVELYNPKTP